MDTTKHLRIAGRVQGVCYRYSLVREAAARGVRGWVRNRRDGTVEAVLQGETAAVDAVIAWTRQGPPAARVDRVDVAEEAGAQCYERFGELPTA
jgi:acylphosphatase